MPEFDAGNGELNRRKLAHLKACEEAGVDLGRDGFSHWRLIYQALPEIALQDVTTQSSLADRPISAPLIISSMTGGVGEPFVTLNRRLAEAAETLRIPLGLGSMKVLLAHAQAQPSFSVRDIAPSVPIIANLGVVSFNYGLGPEEVNAIIDIVRPDVFGFHLNALQEAIQEGGDTDFRGLREKLGDMIARIHLPILVKECGGGIHPRLVSELISMGVDYVDVSGSDGTSWSAVEARLSSDPEFGELFRDFGLPTAWILERLDASLRRSGRIVASGGIRNGLQAAKAIALGADFVAMARPFLLAATESTEAVVAVGRRLIRELQTAMFLVGAPRLDNLTMDVLDHSR